jgi:hypothetical protein
VLYVRSAFALLFFGFGAWQMATQRAQFLIGGRSGSPHRGIRVNAAGLDAVVIGFVFVALGLLVLVEGIRGPARIKAFWCGTGVLAATVLFGLFRMVQGMLA